MTAGNKACGHRRTVLNLISGINIFPLRLHIHGLQTLFDADVFWTNFHIGLLSKPTDVLFNISLEVNT